MKMQRHLIMSDLDGTLLNNEGVLTEFTIKTVKRVIDQGHVFCIVTGRPPRATDAEIYSKLGLNTVIGNFNGALLRNPTDLNFKDVNLVFSKEILKRIVDDKEIMNIISNGLVETEKAIYWLKELPDPNQAYYKSFHISQFENHINIDLDSSKLAHDAYSLLLHIKNAKDFPAIANKIKNIAPTMIVRKWLLDDSTVIVEVNSRFSNKGNALGYLSSYYSIPISRTISFGDGENDIEMIRDAHIGFAMNNATITTKTNAQVISEYNNEENGVAIELINYFEL